MQTALSLKTELTKGFQRKFSLEKKAYRKGVQKGALSMSAMVSSSCAPASLATVSWPSVTATGQEQNPLRVSLTK